MRAYGIEFNVKPKYHLGLQNFISNYKKIPLTFQKSILHVSPREATDEDLYKCHIINLTFDEPWDPQDINDQDLTSNDFRGGSMCQTNATKLSKVIRNDSKVVLRALGHAVTNSENI